MTDPTVTLARRYCGPPNSANGGYAAGRLAGFLPGCAEVTLHRPPPLDTPLNLVSTHAGVELWHAGERIASAVPASLAIEPIAAPTAARAAAAAARTFGAAAHTLPSCFVCGPGRRHGDGLRIHVGPVEPDDRDWDGVLAAPWVPAASLADDDGLVRSEFLWAALDCPTAYACGNGDGLRSILLGRQTVHIERRPAAGERCVVAAQFRGRERRKRFAEALLCGADGAAVASCRATWIDVPAAVQRGA